MLLYNPYFEICAFVFLLMVTVIFFIKENLFTLQSTFYGAFLIVVLICLALDVTTAYTISYSGSVSLSLNIILNTLFFAANSTAALMYALYAMILTDRMVSIRRRNKGAFLYLLFLPYLAAVFFYFFNIKAGLLFYFDDMLRYTHGRYYRIYFSVCLLYFLIGIFVLLRNRKRLPSEQFITLLIYTFLTLGAIIMQYYMSYHLVAGAFAAFGLICMYFTFQNPDTYIDSMTMILGRSGFLVAAGQAIRWHKKPICIITVDINNFKSVNNNFGILSGDELIHRVVEYLQSVAPSKRRLFRIGGDQFAIISNEAEADRTVDLIRRRFKYSWTVFDNKIHISASLSRIPISSYISNEETLMQLVENTLVLAKEAGRGSYIVVDDKVLSAIKRKAKIENRLRDFEKNNCLSINFQPIYSVAKGRITSAEVLLRMYDDELGLVPPDEFIRIAEHSGMILQVGHFVLLETCRFITENRLWEYGIDIIDLNLSPAECMQENCARNIKDIISNYPFKKNILNFEITETVASTSADRVNEIMETLSELGVSFSLDDYSQGYSNSDTIIRFPFKAVKLDKTLLWSAFENEKANIVYRNIVQMLKEMEMRIIAEGAESPHQADFLSALGVDFIQGYYYGKPLSKEAFLSALIQSQIRTQS